jgi:hypothetical protein
MEVLSRKEREEEKMRGESLSVSNFLLFERLKNKGEGRGINSRYYMPLP